MSPQQGPASCVPFLLPQNLLQELNIAWAVLAWGSEDVGTSEAWHKKY